MKKRILVFAGWYLPGNKSGGPAKTLSNLIEATGEDYAYSVVTRDRDLGDSDPYDDIRRDDWNTVGHAEVRYIPPGLRGWFEIARIISATGFDLIYLNSFFSIKFSFFPAVLGRRAGHPVILGPRGQFTKGALALKPVKKRLFIRLFAILRLHKRVVWQASSDYEQRDILEVFRAPLDLVVAENIASRSYARDLPKKQADTLKVVFLSRISPMKNLEFAIRVLKDVTVPVTFDIYGPLEDQQYWVRCESAIEALPAQVRVSLMGAIPSKRVVETMAGYDLFFLPTKGENYGHVITEALCAGLPVLISDTTPWRDLNELGIGWDLPLSTPQDFVRCIHDVNNMTDKAHAAFREHVLAWARARFDDPGARNANRAMFERVLNQSS